MRQLQAYLMNFEIIILTIYYENKENKKGVPQTAQIHKLESIFTKFPSQFECGWEHILRGTARGVLIRN